MSAAQHVLEQAYSLPRIEALAVEPGVYAERLAEALPSADTLADLEARDAALASALGQIDAMIVRAMRVRLDHALAADTSIGAPTRSVFASRIVGCVGRLTLLAERARDVAMRGRAGAPGRVCARCASSMAPMTFSSKRLPSRSSRTNCRRSPGRRGESRK